MSQYPQRPSHFAHKYCRLLFKSCACQEIGRDAAALCCHVVHTEDAARYQCAVRFWNSQLMETLGFKSKKQLEAARKKAIRYGWLHYGRRNNRSVGFYWVTVPTNVLKFDDSPIETDEFNRSANGTNGKSNRSAGGSNSGSNSGSTSIPTPIPIPNQGGKPVATSTKATSPPVCPSEEDAFERFWKLYPARNGRKREKAKARTAWKKLSAADRREALRAAGLLTSLFSVL